MAWYLSVLTYLWDLFKLWFSTIFIIPFKNTDMLWILVPVWLSWFFAEFFQEKVGTSMGNAISNSVVALWGGIDCIRQTVKLGVAGIVKGSANLIGRYSLAGAIFLYGLLVIILGVRGSRLIQRIGRIREVSYVFVIFVPVFYNAIPFSWNLVIAAVLFFPLGYFVIEIIDRITPDPKALKEDLQGESPNKQNLGMVNEGSFNNFNPNSFDNTGMNQNQGYNRGGGNFGYNNLR